MGKIAAVGDIHGEFEKLHDIVGQLEDTIDFEKDTVVFVGDYVDGGSNTQGVIDYLVSLQEQHPHFVFLYGNHEDMMLDALVGNSLVYGSFYQWWNQGGAETAKSSGSRHSVTALKMIDPKHIAWIQSLPYTYETDHFIFVHAGLRQSDNVDDTPDFDKIWIRNEFYDSSYPYKKTIIYGHTVNPGGPRIRPRSIGIDTMHHGHGSITAVVLDNDTGDVIQYLQSFE